MGGAEGDADTIRLNGFQRPLHKLQILSWVVFAFDVAVFVFLYIPLVADPFHIIVTVIFGFSVLVLVIFAARATALDPSDPNATGEGELSALTCEDKVMQDCIFCASCGWHVRPRSKHCDKCNTCVATFDHHCMWLNNCVGENNYLAFVACISSVVIFAVSILCACAELSVQYFADEATFDKRWSNAIVLASIPKELALALICFLVLINLPFFVLDSQLCMLHVFLAWHNMTTYEYIMHKYRQMSDDVDERRQRDIRPMKTLPRCMDWIVFKYRRLRSVNKVKRMSSLRPTAEEDVSEGVSFDLLATTAAGDAYDLRPPFPPEIYDAADKVVVNDIGGAANHEGAAATPADKSTPLHQPLENTSFDNEQTTPAEAPVLGKLVSQRVHDLQLPAHLAGSREAKAADEVLSGASCSINTPIGLTLPGTPASLLPATVIVGSPALYAEF